MPDRSHNPIRLLASDPSAVLLEMGLSLPYSVPALIRLAAASSSASTTS